MLLLILFNGGNSVYSGSSDGENEGFCIFDKWDICVELDEIKTTLEWSEDLLDTSSLIYKNVTHRVLDLFISYLYIAGPYTLKGLALTYSQAEDGNYPTILNIHAQYGTQLSTLHEQQQLRAVFEEVIMWPIIGVIQTETDLFGQFNDGNTLYSLQRAFHTDCAREDQSFPCPSAECWTFSETNQKCVEKRDKNGSPVCSDVKCNFDRIDISFNSRLFGVEHDGFPNPWKRESLSPTPRWNGKSDRWELSCPLGECDMEITKELLCNTE